MKISLEFVPDWAADKVWPARQTSFLSESIETGMDVNNYYEAQWDFFRQLFMLDNGGIAHKPLINMGATCVADMWKLVMSQAELADPNSTYDPKTAHGRVVIQTGITAIESAEDCNTVYSMTDSPSSYLDDGDVVLKRFVRFSASKDEKTIFINMTNEPDPSVGGDGTSNWVMLDCSKDHATYRVSFYESLLSFLREVVCVNNAKGDAKFLFSRYPTLAYAYNYCLSYGS